MSASVIFARYMTMSERRFALIAFVLLFASPWAALYVRELLVEPPPVVIDCPIEEPEPGDEVRIIVTPKDQPRVR